MSEHTAHIEATVVRIEGLTDELKRHTGVRIDASVEALTLDGGFLLDLYHLETARQDALLIRYVHAIAQNAVYHTARAYWHASPSVIAVLAVIWAVIEFIWKIVKVIIQVVEIIQALHLDDLLAKYWPAFQEARNKWRAWASELSEVLGWGVDGLLHLVHATQGFTDVLGGVFGKDYTWMEAEWMVKTGNVLQKIQTYSRQIKDDPGSILEILFQGELKDSFKIASKFGDELFTNVRDSLTKAKRALSGLGEVADELSAIQNNMPNVVRQNIPGVIWDSLDVFSDTISRKILPRMAKLDAQLAFFDNLFDAQQGTLSELADKLAHPGTTLLGIDSLPDYAQGAELGAVDDVASRLFGELTDQERADMQGELDEFEIIDAAITAPLPEPEFMSLEAHGKTAARGITVEDRETWFIGGFSDSH